MSQRILQNTSAVLSRTFSPDGTPTNADGDVTVVGTDEGGTEIFNATATSNGSGNYSHTVTPQAQLNRIEVVWTGTWSGQVQVVNEFIEIVGEHIFTESQARAYDNGAMSDTAAFTDAAIAQARDRITDTFEQLCSVSFVPRYERQQIPGTGTNDLIVEKRRVGSIIAASINGTAQTVTDLEVLAYHTDTIRHTAGIWAHPTRSNPNNVTIEYTHGYDSAPLEVTRAALAVLRHQLVPSNISERALSYSDDAMAVQLAQPGFQGAYYGIPWVDRVLEEFSERVAVF